jgi:hypothetical protein
MHLQRTIIKYLVFLLDACPSDIQIVLWNFSDINISLSLDGVTQGIIGFYDKETLILCHHYGCGNLF